MILFCGLCIVIHIAHSCDTQFVDFNAVENATLETVSKWMFDCISSPRHIIYNSSGERKKNINANHLHAEKTRPWAQLARKACVIQTNILKAFYGASMKRITLPRFVEQFNSF